MALHHPVVTIGMPVFNASKTLEMALRSLLMQTYDDWELIVIDDGSNDESAAIVQSFQDARIRLVSDGLNLGLPARLNRMIQMGAGRYFARMDADDIAFPDRLKNQVGYLDQNPEIDLLGCGALAFSGEGQPLGVFRVSEHHGDICRHPATGFCLPHPSWMGRMDWFKGNLYDPSMRKAQDQELLLRTYAKSRFACLPEVLMGYRLEDANLKKNLQMRYFFCKALLNHALRQGGWTVALVGVSKQLLKAGVEILVRLLRLTPRLQQRRFAGLPEGTRRGWQSLWQVLSARKS